MDESLWTVRQQDCVEGLKDLPAGTVDLVFADPPFNIGYEYDVYDDRQKRDDYLAWCRSWIAAVHRALEAVGHVLAGDRRRIRRRAEAPEPGDRLSLPELGHLVLHVRRQLHAQVQPLARPSVLLRQGCEKFHLSPGRPGKPRSLGPPARLRRRPRQSPRPAAGRHLDPAPAGPERLLHARERTRGISRGWPARSRSGPAFTAARCPSNFWPASSARAPNEGELVVDPFCRQRHDAGRRQEARPPLSRF